MNPAILIRIVAPEYIGQPLGERRQAVRSRYVLNRTNEMYLARRRSGTKVTHVSRTPSPDGELGREAWVGNPKPPQACPSRRALRPGGTAGGGRMNAGGCVRGQGVGYSPNSTIHHSPRSWFPKWSSAEPGSSLPTLRPRRGSSSNAHHHSGHLPPRTQGNQPGLGPLPYTQQVKAQTQTMGGRVPPGHPTPSRRLCFSLFTSSIPPQQVRGRGKNPAPSSRDSQMTAAPGKGHRASRAGPRLLHDKRQQNTIPQDRS
ncbi:unnamed protein product, partial [Gulo gulo]